MTYSATTWVNGDTITATLFNNTESQYQTYKTDWGYVKYSTASTGTNLMSVTSTVTQGSYIYEKLLHFWVPPHVQKSRVEISVTTLATATTALLAIRSGFVPTLPASNNENYPVASFLGSSNPQTVVLDINVSGGETIALWGRQNPIIAAYWWNFKISGTSTDPSPITNAWAWSGSFTS